MPSISFSTLKDRIISGEKKQTIRPKKSDYWLQYEEGDYLVGYWKLRTEGASEKLFESQLSEDPFVVKVEEWTNDLAKRDGFESDKKWPALDHMKKWFEDKYGEDYLDMEFVVLRWD